MLTRDTCVLTLGNVDDIFFLAPKYKAMLMTMLYLGVQTQNNVDDKVVCNLASYQGTKLMTMLTGDSWRPNMGQCL